MHSKKYSVMFVFGEGGHNAQASRLALKLKPVLNKDIRVISLSDIKEQPDWSDFHYETKELRDKGSNFKTFTRFAVVDIFYSLKYISKKENVKVIISTGPGLSFLSALFFKCFGAKIIHVETWSRFTTKSFTGFMMYYLSDKFYVQNKSLLNIYPKAEYSGRL